MKSILLLVFIITAFPAISQEEKREFEVKEGDTTFIMKKYFLCIYLRGDQATEYTKEELAEIQKGHLANINKYAEEGKINIAGPFGDDTEKRGILIFDVNTLEEAEKILAEDPAVKAGRLKYELHPWWGAKGSVLK